MRKLFLILLAVQLVSCGDKNDNPTPKHTIEGKTFIVDEVYKFNEIKEGNFITQFEFDTNGVLWVATFNGGVLRVENKEVTQYKADNADIGSDTINDLFIDPNNQVWIATNKGFSLFEKGEWRKYDTSNTPLFENYISEVGVNKSGDILVGNGRAGTGGMLLYSNGSWRTFTSENSAIPSTIIKEIETTSAGDFWVGTSMFQGKGGLVKVSDGAIEQVYDATTSGLLYNAVDNIELTDNDELWLGYSVLYHDIIGYPDGGIQKLSPGSGDISSWFPYDTKQISNRILSIKLSKDGDLWFSSTSDELPNCIHGLGVLNKDGSFDILSAVNYEIAANIYIPWVTDDKDGSIFIANENRILKVTRK